MDTILVADAGPAVITVARAVIAAQAQLSEIDGQTGDGDHGINMAKGFRLVIERLGERKFGLTEGLRTVGDTLLGDIGGSMGPLYGSFFTEAADALGDHETLDAPLFGAMLRAGEAAIVDLGQARPGDKTLIDVLTPARAAFDASVAAGQDFGTALEALVAASRAGLEATRDMVARLGRASRLGERSRGVLDAGAASCDIILRAIADDLRGRLGAPDEETR